MKKKSVAVAYPSIPVIFNNGVRTDRIPRFNTMGLAVTDVNGEVRTETSVEVTKGKGVHFFVNGKELEWERLVDVKKIVKFFQERANSDVGLKIESTNHKIYSGSSDSGMAALVAALNDVFQTNLSQEELGEISMCGSETSIRSVYGGLNELIVDTPPKVYGKQLASETDLKDVRIFALTFDYETRVTAEMIFQACQSHPWFKHRVEMVPTWVARIKRGLLEKNLDAVFSTGEENIRQAHHMIEESGIRCRKREMMVACIDVEEMREQGFKCYWSAGGGRVINVISWNPHADKVLAELKKRGYKPTEYKVASGAKIVHSE